MIPVFKPSVGEEELFAIREVLESGWLGLGPKTQQFEEEFAHYVGASFAVGVNSGTAALHLSLLVLGVGKGDEVIVPSLTFISTTHSVLYNGAKPIFADIEEDTLTISPEDIERKITERTKVIIPMHYGGHPCDLDSILEIAKKRGIYVVEDAAHACGAEYKGRKIGSISDITCFSFHAVKNLTTGEGGMITTESAEIDARLRRLRWVGIDRDTWTRSHPTRKPSYAWQYEVAELGYKYHMHDLAAAIGLVQLRKLDSMNQRRHDIVTQYNQAFQELKEVELPVEREYVKSAHHIYALRVRDRDELISHLKQNDISPGVHYYPNHMHPFYRKYKTQVPITERIWERLISLPLYPDLTSEEVQRVIDGVKSFYQQDV